MNDSKFLLTLEAVEKIHSLYCKAASEAGLSLPLPPFTDEVEEILTTYAESFRRATDSR
jgi:hypothetical protein